jgi:hypothetical protein
MASSALVATAVRRTARPVAVAPDELPDSRPDVTPNSPPDMEPDTSADAEPDTVRPTRPARRKAATGTAAAIARLHKRHPDMSPAEIGRRVGVSDRTVRRHLAALREIQPDTSAPVAA